MSNFSRTASPSTNRRRQSPETVAPEVSPAGCNDASRPASRARSRPRTDLPPTAHAEEAVNVKVVCRLRPMSEREKRAGTVPAVTASTERREVTVLRGIPGKGRASTAFHFDSVLGSYSTQEETFAATLEPLVEQVLGGYEATAFAYGQTGTGKTYTMEGDTDSEEGRGLMPRAATAVLEALSTEAYVDFSVTVSYLEIYNEELGDLLAPAHLQQKLDLMDTHRGVCCVGLSEVKVSSVADILELVRRAQERRRVAETRINARSSRSHCIFTMKVQNRKRVAGGEIESVGKLHLVDLAGSECAKKAAWGPSDGSGATAAEQERERKNINQSLLTLGRVIAALRESSGRIPYRDSKLTRLLKDALGGSCKTVLIATVSPALSAADETASTLGYAEQAAGIQNRPVASSLMRGTRMGGLLENRGDGTGAGNVGCVEWAELEMKIAYLQQEVEEAQSALARKYNETQELIESREKLDQELASARVSIVYQQQLLKESGAIHQRMAEAAHELVDNLNTAVRASTEACQQAKQELEDLKTQRIHEEQIVALLARQREALQADIAQVCSGLEDAKADLAKTRSESERLRAEHKRSQESALEAIMKVATAEIEKLGAASTSQSEAISRSVDHATATVDGAIQSIGSIEEKSTAVGHEIESVAVMWSTAVAAKCESFYDSTCAAAKVLDTAVDRSVQSLRKIEAGSNEGVNLAANVGNPNSDTSNATDSDASVCGAVSPIVGSNMKENADIILPTVVHGKSASSPRPREGARTAFRELNRVASDT